MYSRKKLADKGVMVCRDNNAIERAGLIAAVEQAADAIVITDTAGNIQYVNPAFTTLTGYTREEAMGQNPRILKSGQQHAGVLRRAVEHHRFGAGLARRGDQPAQGPNHISRGDADHPGPGCAGRNCQLHRHQTGRDRGGAQKRKRKPSWPPSWRVPRTPSSPFRQRASILTWNRGAEAIFGYSSAEAAGKPMSTIVPPERHRALQAFAE